MVSFFGRLLHFLPIINRKFVDKKQNEVFQPYFDVIENVQIKNINL